MGVGCEGRGAEVWGGEGVAGLVAGGKGQVREAMNTLIRTRDKNKLKDVKGMS